MNSKGDRTRCGVLYGIKQPVLKQFSVSFEGVSQDERTSIERYLAAMQFVKPHLVEPYDREYFPPVYCGLTGGGDFTKRPGKLLWDTSLEYLEAR